MGQRIVHPQYLVDHPAQPGLETLLFTVGQPIRQESKADG